jgi:general stress protein 26
MQDHDSKAHFLDVIKDFDTGFLITRGAGGALHARPMAMAEVQAGGDIVFSTSIASPKIAEIAADPRVLVTLQAKSQFATLEGSATVMRDRAEIDRLWSEAWRVWFPGGKDDPNLCLLKVRPRAGEYWDNSGVQGVSFLLESVKAVVQGRQPDVDEKRNAKVKL